MPTVDDSLELCKAECTSRASVLCTSNLQTVSVKKHSSTLRTSLPLCLHVFESFYIFYVMLSLTGTQELKSKEKIHAQ